MKTNRKTLNSAMILTTFILICFLSNLKGQGEYFQVQIGSQLMQNYNLGHLGYSSSGYTAFTVTKEDNDITFNQDLSLTGGFNNHHSVTFGVGLYNTCRVIDGEYVTDTRSQTDYKDVNSCYKNYSLYLMYRYTTWISTRWNCHLSAGPMWAKNHNMVDWFFMPVKIDYFSGMIKLGVQYKLSKHFLVELNGVGVRSFTNIVDNSYWVQGSFIPFLVGADLRMGYQF